MKFKDVILIVPPLWEKPKREQEVLYEHLGVGYLLTSLPIEISAGFIDAYNYMLSFDEIVKQIKEHQPQIVGISCNFYPLLPSTIYLAKMIKEMNPTIHITVGGHGIVHEKEKVLKSGYIDSLCLCEGELCFPEFVENYLLGEKYWYTKGIWFNHNGKIIRNLPRELVSDLNNLSFPKRSNIITNRYLAEDFPNSAYTVITSRGCPYMCKFCDIKAFYDDYAGESWRMRSAKNVVDEIEDLYRNHNAKILFLGDDNFIGSCKRGVDRAYEFCDLMEEKDINVKFGIEARVTDMDKKLLRRLKEVGLISVMLGVENASPRLLRDWNKQIKPEDSKKAILILKELGIRCHVNYILYDMYSTLDELYESYHFLKEMEVFRDEDPIHFYDNRLGIFPGTEIESEFRGNPLLIKKELTIPGIETVFLTYDYHYENLELQEFNYYNNYWIDIMNSIKNKLDQDQRKIYDSTCGILYLKAFKLSIDLASEQKEGRDTKRLDNMIADYLGKTFLM